jgi:16S rRNA (guanine966-N2)-methyltransferase
VARTRKKNSPQNAGRPPTGRLRIVAGKWRSRRLDIVDVPGLRPTGERIRETVFNWLAPYIQGARCLDLFAGTGALGLEALSRGAAEVIFVERSQKAAAALRRNASLLGASEGEIIEQDARDYLRQPASRPFDIVFLDPPFADEMLEDLCQRLDDGNLLRPGAMVYVEEERSSPAIALPDGWRLLRTKQAGMVRYSLLAAEREA